MRVSPGCPTHIINGHAGTSSDEGSPRKGVDIICKVSLSIMRAHLDKFLSPCEVLPRLSYSQWIAALHPESVITSSAGEQGEPTIDERMFHRMSEHLTMWNAHPLVTEDQRIVPKNSTILSESKNVLEKEDDNKFFEDRNIQEDDYTGALSINDTSQPIEFETELFKGVAMIRINLENCDFTLKSSSDESYFSAGRKRKMQVCVQGRFKRPLRFDQVYSGQEFSRPLKNVPAKRLVRWGFSILKPRLPPSFRADLFCPQPYFLSPLILTSSRARCDWPSKEPNVASYDFEEDFVSLHLSEARFQKSATQVVSNTTDQMEPVSIHPPLSKRNTRLKVRNVKNQLAAKERKKQQAILKAEKAAKAAQEFQAIAKLSLRNKAEKKAQKTAVALRKKVFGDIKALTENVYNPNLIYTFDYYQQFYRASSNKLDLGVKLVDLTYYLGEQPLLLSMAKTIDTNEYLWKFEVWNESAVKS